MPALRLTYLGAAAGAEVTHTAGDAAARAKRAHLCVWFSRVADGGPQGCWQEGGATGASRVLRQRPLRGLWSNVMATTTRGTFFEQDCWLFSVGSACTLGSAKQKRFLKLLMGSL